MPKKSVITNWQVGSEGSTVPCLGHDGDPSLDSPMYAGFPWKWRDAVDQCCFDIATAGYYYPCGFQDANVPLGWPPYTDTRCCWFETTRKRCDNRYLRPGWFQRPVDYPYYWTPTSPGSYADPGCRMLLSSGGTTVIATDPGLTAVRTLSQACHDHHHGGNFVLYLDGNGNAMPYTGATVAAAGYTPTNMTAGMTSVRQYHHAVVLGLAGSYEFVQTFPLAASWPHWMLHVPTWNEHCFRQEQYWDGNGFLDGTKGGVGVWVGCPPDFVEDYDGLTYTYIYPNLQGHSVSRTSQSIVTVTNYDVRGGSHAQGLATHGRCYLAEVDCDCPDHMTDTAGECVGDCIEPECQAGYEFAMSHPGIVGSPLCIQRTVDYLRSAPQQFVRGLGDTLLTVLGSGNPAYPAISPLAGAPAILARWGDSIPESASATEQLWIHANVSQAALSASLGQRASGEVDVFFLVGKDTNADTIVDQVDVCHVQVNDIGRSVANVIVSAPDPAIHSMVQRRDGAGNLIETYWVTRATLASGQTYRILRHLITPDGLALFLWRDNTWWVRTAVRDAGSATGWGALSPERSVVVTEDNSGFQVQLTKDGIEFWYYSTAGHVRRARCPDLSFSTGLGGWVDADLVDAVATEYLSFVHWFDRNLGFAVFLVWVPNVLGEWIQGTSSTLGSWKTIIAKPTGDDSWTLTAPVAAWSNVGIGSGSLRRRRDGAFEVRLSGEKKICRDLNLDTGVGTWSNP